MVWPLGHRSKRFSRLTVQMFSQLAELCEVMDVHPLTLLTLAYVGDSAHQADELLARVARGDREGWPAP